MACLEKDPGDRIDLAFDFSTVLAAGERIDVVDSVVVSPDGELTLHGSAVIEPASGAEVVQMVSGGTHGREYRITLKVTTDQGAPDPRQFERSFLLLVRDL